MKKFKSALNLIGSFFYNNWFIIPMLICLYGISASYHSAQTSLYMNFVLWLLAGALMEGSLKEKDREMETKNQRVEELLLFIEETAKTVDSKKEFNKNEYPTLAQYPAAKIWEAVEKLQAKYPDMTEEQCLLNLEIDLAQIEQMA